MGGSTAHPRLAAGCRQPLLPLLVRDGSAPARPCARGLVCAAVAARPAGRLRPRRGRDGELSTSSRGRGRGAPLLPGLGLPPGRPFHAAIGLAVRRLGDHGRPFERLSQTPVLEAADASPATPPCCPMARGLAHVVPAGLPWARAGGAMLPRYASPRPGRLTASAGRWCRAPACPGPCRVRWRRATSAPGARGSAGAPPSAAAATAALSAGRRAHADGRRWTREAAPPLVPEGWEDGALCYPTVWGGRGAPLDALQCRALRRRRARSGGGGMSLTAPRA